MLILSHIGCALLLSLLLIGLEYLDRRRRGVDMRGIAGEGDFATELAEERMERNRINHASHPYHHPSERGIEEMYENGNIERPVLPAHRSPYRSAPNLVRAVGSGHGNRNSSGSGSNRCEDMGNLNSIRDTRAGPVRGSIRSPTPNVNRTPNARSTWNAGNVRSNRNLPMRPFSLSTDAVLGSDSDDIGVVNLRDE